MNPVFSCKHITQELEHFKLADITFALNAGCILGVIGKNGSGKTTLLRTLMGMQSTQGDARILGYSLQKDEKEYKKQMAYVLNELPFRMNVNALTNGMFREFVADCKAHLQDRPANIAGIILAALTIMFFNIWGIITCTFFITRSVRFAIAG